MNEPIFSFSTGIYSVARPCAAILRFCRACRIAVLAADGGLRNAMAAGFHPAAVIGDMDSLDIDADLLPDIEFIGQRPA